MPELRALPPTPQQQTSRQTSLYIYRNTPLISRDVKIVSSLISALPPASFSASRIPNFHPEHPFALTASAADVSEARLGSHYNILVQRSLSIVRQRERVGKRERVGDDGGGGQRRWAVEVGGGMWSLGWRSRECTFDMESSGDEWERNACNYTSSWTYRFIPDTGSILDDSLLLLNFLYWTLAGHAYTNRFHRIHSKDGWLLDNSFVSNRTALLGRFPQGDDSPRASGRATSPDKNSQQSPTDEIRPGMQELGLPLNEVLTPLDSILLSNPLGLGFTASAQMTSLKPRR